MLVVLTVATVFIAVVLAVVHWQTVREILLWIAAVINLLSMVSGLLALLGAVIVFIWAAIVQSTTLVPVGVALAIVALVLLIVSGVLWQIEHRDRAKQFAKFRTWARAWYEDQLGNKSSDKDT